MSDEAIGWDDWGGDEQAKAMLPAATYEGTITMAQWGKAKWVAAKYPDVNPEGRVLYVKVEIDVPAGYAEVIVTVPRQKDQMWRVRRICEAAGVSQPSKDGPAWSPAALLSKQVQVETSIYTNERTGESKVQIDNWLPLGPVSQDAPKAAKGRAAKQKVEAAGERGSTDDIPF